ncbi:hypothetical protein BX265_5626 [Streptomyces sp. TLI_235]|nr:hypothetical protein BX265_5626 [Streptomyces sp. TLI_235]
MPATRNVSRRPSPPTAPVRRLLALTLTALTTLTAGGCMSTPGKNDPLPVMAKTDAQAWAQHMTEFLAQTAGVTLTPATAKPFFSNCVGKNDEVVDDGRYTLSYAVDSTVPLQQHPEAVKKIRAALEQQKFTIDGYRETWEGKPSALLDATNTDGRYLVSVETGGGTDRLLFRINTRCLMPPSTPSPTQH